MEWQERDSDKLGYTERDFKVCDFCGALNPALNNRCLACGWNGRFHNDRETVRAAIETIKGKYGELDDSLFTEDVLPSTPPHENRWAGIWNSVKRLLSRA